MGLDLSPTASYEITDDDDIVHVPDSVYEVPFQFRVNATGLNTPAGEELAAESTEGATSNPNFLSQILSSIGKSYHSNWGYLELAGGAALIGFLIWRAVSGGASSVAQKENPASVTSQQAAVAANAALRDDLGKTSSALVSMGYSPEVVHANSQRILLTRGTSIALAAQTYAETPGAAADRHITVVGAGSPQQYASLSRLNTEAYLNSLSQKPSNASIIANSAAVHGMSAQNQ